MSTVQHSLKWLATSKLYHQHFLHARQMTSTTRVRDGLLDSTVRVCIFVSTLAQHRPFNNSTKEDRKGQDIPDLCACVCLCVCARAQAIQGHFKIKQILRWCSNILEILIN
jgi:hypothetical protein